MRGVLNIEFPAPPEELRRSSSRLHDRAYAYLKELLLGGGLDPGDQISSESVGRALSISRAPVTDAIRRLTVEGLLEVVPQVGCRVVCPVATEMADFYEIFGATEGVVARFAAERRSVVQADEFARICAELASPSGFPEDPTARFIELRRRNRRRFRKLHELAQSPLSTAIGESFWDRSDFFIRVAFGPRDLPDYVRAGHAAFVAAVTRGDGATAEQETRRYLSRLGQDVAELLGEMLPPRPRRLSSSGG